MLTKEQQKTVLAYKRLVYKNARGYDRDDRAQQGFLGLIKAVLKYDPSKGREYSYFEQGTKAWIRNLSRPKWASNETPVSPDLFEDLANEDTHACLAANELASEVDRVLRDIQMSPSDRDLLNVLMGESTIADVARKWGITRQAMSKRLEKLSARLRRRFEYLRCEL